MDKVDPTKYGVHSLHIGGAAALLAAGCKAEVIMTMGRWSSDISRLYCRANTEDLMHWQRALGRQPFNPAETAEELLRRNAIPIEHLSDGSSATATRP